MDASQTFASLAQVRILLLPVGTIRRATFEKWASEIRSFDRIALGDIPTDSRDDRARFMPNPLSTGYLHTAYVTHPPPASQKQLGIFRPSLFPLAVIGIAECKQTDTLSLLLAQFNAMVHEMFPKHSTYPLARNCFAFEEGDTEGNTNLNIGDQLPGLVLIPSVMGNKKLYLGTLIAELCSMILGEFSILVKGFESAVGNEILNIGLFPEFPTSVRLSSESDSHRRDSMPALPSQHSQPEMSNVLASRALSPGPTSLKRTASTGPGSLPIRSSTLGIPASQKKRQSTSGAQTSHGRLFKFLGDLFLLAGRTMDANIWYSEAISQFKTSTDYAWHASSLEGLAVAGVLDAWAAEQGIDGPSDAAKEPWTEHANKVLQASELYTKALPTSEDDQRFSHLTFLYTTAVLRHTSLLFCIWSAKGWGPLAFAGMLHPGPHPYLPPTLSTTTPLSSDYLDRMSTLSGVSRSQISAALSPLHGPWLLHLAPRDRLVILEAMASIYACISYKRKETYVLREILGCIMDLIVCGRRDYELESPSSTLGLGIHESSAGQFNDRSPLIGTRIKQDNVGNDSILALLKQTCVVQGVNMNAVNFADKDLDEPGIDTDTEGDLESEKPIYGWPELQIGIVREALAVAEALPEPAAVALLCASALKTMHSVFTADDQYHLYTSCSRALATIRRRGREQKLEYWYGNPIMSIELLPLPNARVPFERPLSDLNPETTRNNVAVGGKIDPFLYNPRRSMAGKRGITVALGEQLHFVVTLRNPYLFALELIKLDLSTEGVKFESRHVAQTIPPNSSVQVTIIGKALEHGTLSVRGCIAQTPGSTSRLFLLPLFNAEEEERQARRRSTMISESERIKNIGVRDWMLQKPVKHKDNIVSDVKTAAARSLTLKIVPEQPLLRIRRTSLTHGAVMLYEGETCIVRMVLENVSKIPIDFIDLTFDDSTKTDAQRALEDDSLSAYETYEMEHSLIHHPVFSWERDKNFKELAPGEETVITIKCLGRSGCGNAAIYIDYAQARQRSSSLQRPAESFFTRRVPYPLTVTVYDMLECHSMDILPVSRSGHLLEGESEPSQNRALFAVTDPWNWAFLTFEVRNTYGLPFEVVAKRVEDSSDQSVAATISPGSTHRITLPIRRFLLDPAVTSASIPTLTNRQFVVDKSARSSEDEVSQRQLFWYREELLKSVSVTWREADGTRSGDLSLRNQRLTLPMLRVLQTETVTVSSVVIQDTDNTKTGESHDSHTVSLSHEFVVVRTTVTNRSQSRLTLTASLFLEPVECVICDGVTSNIPLGTLESGDTKELDLSVCFVAEGQFSISAVVMHLDGAVEKPVGTTESTITVTSP